MVKGNWKYQSQENAFHHFLRMMAVATRGIITPLNLDNAFGDTGRAKQP
jgi:hypothetical protein